MITTLPKTEATRTATILIVDDEATLRDTLEYNLRRERYRVLTAADGAAAIRLALAERPDLIVLDLMLPGMSGFEVCRVLRRDLAVPILMLSAREDEIDKVLGLELGADDYLTKPFGLRELLARIHALLRRTAPPASVATPGEERRPLLIVGDLQLDPGARTVQRAGRAIALKPKEFDLLAFLTAHPRQVFSRDSLLDRVWGYDYTGGPRTVDVHIRWLRSKIETDPAHPQLLHTIYSVGYKIDDAPDAAL